VQERFIRAYLDSALALQHCTGFVASEGTEGAVEEAAAQLLQAAIAYIPMSHLIWGLWGLLQVITFNCIYRLLQVVTINCRLQVAGACYNPCSEINAQLCVPSYAILQTYSCLIFLAALLSELFCALRHPMYSCVTSIAVHVPIDNILFRLVEHAGAGPKLGVLLLLPSK